MTPSKGGDRVTRRRFLAGAAGAAAWWLEGCRLPARRANDRHDFVVVGRGPMASATARHLAEAGEDVALVGPLENGDGATRTGPFASHYDAGRQIELATGERILSTLARASLPAFRKLQDTTSISFLRDRANLRVRSPDGRHASWQSVRSIAREQGVELVELSAVALADRFPRLRFPADAVGLLEPNGGIVDPRGMVAAQLEASGRAGATIVEDEVVSLSRRPGHVRVETRAGRRLRADQVLVATGAFTNAARLLERRLALALHGVTVVLIEAPHGPRPEMPTLTCQLDGPDGPRVGFAMPPTEYPDGRWYVKGATASSVTMRIESDDAIGAWFRGRGLTEDAAQLVEMLGEIMPDFEPGPVRTAPCMVAYTPTGAPYIDRVDDRIGVAVGGNAWGVMTSDELGRLAAAMMRETGWSGALAPDVFAARFA